MLEVTVSILLVVAALVAAYEYFAVYRPRFRGILGSADKASATGAVVAGHLQEVSAAAKDRLLRWLEGSATQAEERLQALERSIAQVQSTQALAFVQSLYRALATMQRFRSAPSRWLLEDARRDLRRGLADLTLYVRLAPPELLLQHHEVSCAMLTVANHAAGLEVEVLRALGQAKEVPAAQREHQQLGQLWQSKLQDLGDLHRRLFPPAVRQGCGGRPGLARAQQLQLAERVTAGQSMLQ